MENRVRRRSDCLDGSARNSRRVDSAAIPVDVWYAAVFLEAPEYAVSPEIWNAGMDRVAEHFCFSAGVAADLADYRFDVPWVDSGVGIDEAASIVAATAELGYGGPGAISFLLPVS